MSQCLKTPKHLHIVYTNKSAWKNCWVGTVIVQCGGDHFYEMHGWTAC